MLFPPSPALPRFPAFSLVLEGDSFIFNCTPTTDTLVVTTIGFGSSVLGATSVFTKNEVTPADSTRYECSGYEGQVTRQTDLFVFPG